MRFREKKIKLLLTISIVLNVLLLGYVVKRAIRIYSNHKQAIELEKKLKLDYIQPDTVTYVVGRNEVFTKLPNDSDEVVMLGNSLTQNFEWHEMFKNVNIKNRGIGGDITKGILQRINEVVESKPKKVFIEIGINDLLRGFPVDSVFYNYTNIIQTINLKSPKTRIYIQNLLPTNLLISNTNKPVIDSVNALNIKLKNFCSNHKITYIDLFSKFSSDGKLKTKYNCGDNLHLSGEGYSEWCRLIKTYIYE